MIQRVIHCLIVDCRLAIWRNIRVLIQVNVHTNVMRVTSYLFKVAIWRHIHVIVRRNVMTVTKHFNIEIVWSETNEFIQVLVPTNVKIVTTHLQEMNIWRNTNKFIQKWNQLNFNIARCSHNRERSLNAANWFTVMNDLLSVKVVKS